MKRSALALISILGILLVGSLGLLSAEKTPLQIPDDPDNDGVPDPIDKCPTVNASFFDRNGDGCIDDAASARHIEFWTKADLPFVYRINASGAPGITNGSDFTAIQNGMQAWSSIQSVTFPVTYGGTTTQQNANALDQMNLVSFQDNEYKFDVYTIAVGTSTSFIEATTFNGKLYRPGEIIDADLIFNPDMKFKTPTAGSSGTDIQSVVTHEAAHLFGISHSAMKTSTMFYLLVPGTGASSLTTEDKEMFFKAYADSLAVANSNRIAGTVSNGKTDEPVPGAIVFAVNAASGDTVASDYTLPDGSYAFPGLSDGSYYITIHALDTTEAIGYLTPHNVNALVEATAVTGFPPEYYDAAESSTDDATAKTSVSVAGGSKATGIDIITNIDVTPPEVVKTNPTPNASSVRIDAAIKITFSEAIDSKSLKGNFQLVNSATNVFISGKGIFLNDDSLLAFTPYEPLDYGTSYNLTLKTGITDKQKNGLSAQYTMSFTTAPMPPVAITSLAPNKGVVGTVVVINGVGFDRIKANNTVYFGTLQAEIVKVYPNRLIVMVPPNAVDGYVTVQRGEYVSLGINFTVLSANEVARGFQSGIADLRATPRSITVLPTGGYAYVATDQGAAAVVVDPGLSGYLDVTTITIPGGLDAMDAMPNGKMVYGVSRQNKTICAIVSDPSDGQFNTELAEFPVSAEPLGIVIDPSGGKAFVPTTDGEIQIWDVREGSATRHSQIGAISSADPNLLGKMAIDPADDYLCALSGAGKLLVFDLTGDTLYAKADVLLDPRDVIVDPTGQHAYVSDGTGNVSIVPLSGLFEKSQDISPGGSLLGMTMTPAGMYLYACNRQLNLIDVIDMNENGQYPRSLVATIGLESDPVDIERSPDGYYAFTVVGHDRQLIVTTIGLGPTIKSISRRAGPTGTKLVIAGDGFGGGERGNQGYALFYAGPGNKPTQVWPEYNSGTSMTVTVPSDAESGPVRVAVLVNGGGGQWMEQISNSLYFQVFRSLPAPSRLRLAAWEPTGIGLFPDVELAATGDFLVVGGESPGLGGTMGVFDTDPESPYFNQWIKTTAYTSDYRPNHVALTPDGGRAYLSSDSASSIIQCYNVNHHSRTFGDLVGQIDLSGRGVTRFFNVSASPNGEILLACGQNAGWDSLYAIDIVPGSTSENTVIEAIAGIGGHPIFASDIAFHPGGQYAYIADSANESVDVLCLQQGVNYLRVIAMIDLHGVPIPNYVHSVSFVPNGTRCLVLVSKPNTKHYDVVSINTSDPANPVLGTAMDLGVTNYPGGYGILKVSPRGDRALAAVPGHANGYYSIDLTGPRDTVVNIVYYSSAVSRVGLDFTPDGSRVYVAGQAQDSLFIYDFNAADYLTLVSGNEQSGVINQPLAAPLRVSVMRADSGFVYVPGVPITFEVMSGGGYFTDSHLTKQVIATGEDGFAQIKWTLGPVVGTQTQRVRVASEGLVGAPTQFVADSYDDPANVPMQLVQTIPLNTTINVSVTSAVQGIFSRAVLPDSIKNTTFYVHRTSDAAAVAVIKGFADGNRKVSLIPVTALDYSTGYTLVATSSIHDASDQPLKNPGSYVFTTAAKPPLVLTSVTPPSVSAAATLVLSGKGFDPVVANDKVLFNDLEATPSEAGVDYVNVKVPSDAITGTIRVVCGNDTSNAQPFTMLVPSTSLVDEVLATINTGSSVKSVAVTPDGALAYSVSPDADIVIPIDVDGQTTYPSISVGDDPVAITIHPDNTYAYVANFGSATVSVICVNPDSARFNKVVETIKVGTNPIDVAASPDGDRIYVVNLGSVDISIIDGDADSETHHSVLATVSTGTAAKSVLVSPDGARLFLGTNTGYVVFDTKSNEVTATVNTGAATKSVSITPDGLLLIVVTTGGTINIYDVAPGSKTPNKVLASVNTGSTVKSVSITPDGAVLTIILDGSDKAILYSLTVIGSSTAFNPETPVPLGAVVLTPIDTIPTGRDPQCIVFDRSGSGLALICNAGDNTITFLNASSVPAGALKAEILVQPRTLNLRSRGRWVTGNIELPAGYWPEEIDISTVLLQNAIHAESQPSRSREYEDSDRDGLRELVVKFDRAAFQNVLPQGEYVPVTITGKARNRSFIGYDTIRTIRPCVKFPSKCALTMGEMTTITWTSPAGYKVDSVSIDWTPNDGRTWFSVAHGIADTKACPWRVPETSSDSCRVMVTLFAGRDILGQGMSQEMFQITAPVAVTVQEFSGVLAKGAVVLKWSTVLEQSIEGFNLVRSEGEEGLYERVNAKAIPSTGAAGGAYEFRDSTIALNRSYFYKLEEVSGRDSKVIFGPYRVACRAPFELAQNVPNPFNPVTSIRFTIPEDSYVTLAVYDAAGRRICTLVDKQMKANFYRVYWNGKNDAGRRVATGMYFYRIHAGRYTQSRKMLLLR